MQKQQQRVAVAYCRVSTAEQADSGSSLMAQAAKVNALAALHDVQLVEVITDRGLSAKDTNREGLQRVLTLADGGKVSMVLVSKLDRLTRSVRDLGDILERFERKKVGLVSAAENLDTASATGRLMLNLLMSVSEWERGVIAERTSTVLQHKRSVRQAYTRIDPYGFTRENDVLVPVPSEQEVITRMQAWRASGWSLRKIINALDRESISPKNGGKWHAKVILGILNNPIHTKEQAA